MTKNIIKGNMLDMGLLIEAGEKPALFSEREELFWDDPHISKQMLEAHLNPEWDAASRRHETIDHTVEWLVNYLDLKEGDRVLDLGCGPGLYCTRLRKHGLDVTGMDYSRNSIDYATRYAAENGLDIRYIYQNYLTMDYTAEFDAIFLIYCDFGALTDADRDALLGRIRKALKPGGIFVFDVFTRYYKEPVSKAHFWYAAESGFWRPAPHLVLKHTFHYEEENVVLDQYTVVDEDGRVTTYKIWNRYYSAESISEVMKENGFAVRSIWSGLTGEPYDENAVCLGIVAGRKE